MTPPAGITVALEVLSTMLEGYSGGRRDDQEPGKGDGRSPIIMPLPQCDRVMVHPEMFLWALDPPGVPQSSGGGGTTNQLHHASAAARKVQKDTAGSHKPPGVPPPRHGRRASWATPGAPTERKKQRGKGVGMGRLAGSGTEEESDGSGG
ncbi:unnamed protein product, partial [Discosporangium mesarthrocarpum]